MHSSWLLVVSASWCKFRDFVANTVEALFVTVSCEHIMMHSSWLCCKHLLMHRSWLSCEHITTHSCLWLCCKHLLMHRSWLSCEHITTHSCSWLFQTLLMRSSWLLVVSISRRTVVRDYVSNTADSQFVTVSCEHITTHSSWLCCTHLLMHSLWQL